jgi:hypothetical protein
LARAGANPRIVVDAIVAVVSAELVAVPPDDVTTTQKDLKQLEKQLSDLANDLERIGRKVKETILDPESNAAFWRSLLNAQRDLLVFHDEWTSAHRRNKEIEAQARYLRAQAAAIKSISKRWLEYEKKLRWMNELYRLLRYVLRTTKRPHDQCVANLLQVACGVLGIKASTAVPLTADGMKKFRRRHCPDLKNRGQRPPKS